MNTAALECSPAPLSSKGAMSKFVCKRYGDGFEALGCGQLTSGLRAVVFAVAVTSASIACTVSGIAQEIEFGDAKIAAADISAHGQIHRTTNGTTIVAKEAISTRTLDAARLPTRIFASDSFWYRPIPKDAPLHPNSDNFAADFLQQMKAHYGHVGINTNKFSAPIYPVGPAVPKVAVQVWDCQNKGYLDKGLAKQIASVPIPPYALPADGSDAHMVVYQAASDSLWEFWKARNIDGQWQACWGGGMQSVSKSNGIWPRYYGPTATGLSFIGGIITVDELRRGRIDHVMAIALAQVDDWRVVSWPANRSDGYNPSKLPNRIPEGLRFRLDPTVDVDALKLHPIAKIIAKAAQTYGFVVSDKGGAIMLFAEDPKRFTTLGQPNPYPELWNGAPSYAVLAHFPWGRLQFLPMNYGRP